MKPQIYYYTIKSLLFFLLFLGIFLLSNSFSPVYATAGINRTINFQGKIVNKADATNITNNSYSFTFKFYDDPAAGNQLPISAPWSETQSLTVTNGIFQATLGSSTPIPAGLDFNSDSIYLDITFGGEHFTSRVRMTAVPYALNAEKVGGLTVTSTTGTLTIPNSKTIQFADAFTTSGAFPLTLTTTSSTIATLPAGTITLVDLDTTQTLTGKTIGSTGLIFSGATTDISTVSNQDFAIMPDGTGNVGIGITAPKGKLNIAVTEKATETDISQTTANNALVITGAYGSGDNFFPGLMWNMSDSSPTKANAGIYPQFGSAGSKLTFGISDQYTSGITRSFTFSPGGYLGIGVLAVPNVNAAGNMDVSGTATVSGNITMGGQLQLGRYPGDPAALGNGAMIYNASTNKFRCYQNGGWTDCIGAGGPGSSVWSDLTAPTQALSMNMYQTVGTSFATTFTYGNATSTTNLFNITDTSSNNGTGYLFNVTTASSSTLKPFHISSAGIEAILVDAAGKVGIGNTNPLEKLDITGNASVSGYLTIGQNGSLRSQYGPLTLAYKNTLTTWATGLVLQDTTGNVGIGSTNPTAQLQVVGTSATASVLSVNNTGLTTGKGISVVGGTAMTTGSDLELNGAIYTHAAGETGNFTSFAFTDNSNVAGNSTTTGINVVTTFNLQGASGAKEVDGINIVSPVVNGCSGGNTCTWSGMNVGITANTNAALTERGIYIKPSASQNTAGSVLGIFIDNNSSGASATDTGIKIGTGWDNGLDVSSPAQISSTLTATGTTIIGSAGNTFTFNPASGPSYLGTARPYRTMVLSPEYSGAAITTFYGAGADTNITGTLTSDASNSAGLRTHYSWMSTTATPLQGYTVAVRVTLPANFSQWCTTSVCTNTNALQFDYATMTTGSANNAVDMYIYNSSNTSTAVYSGTNNVSATANTWTTLNVQKASFEGAQTWNTAGDTAIIYLRMKSMNNNFVLIGDIKLNYLVSN